MSQRRFRVTVSLIAVAAPLALSGMFFARVTAEAPADGLVPKFVVDPFWPRPLPNRWLLGQVSGVAVDAQDHVWIIQPLEHRPA